MSVKIIPGVLGTDSSPVLIIPKTTIRRSRWVLENYVWISVDLIGHAAKTDGPISRLHRKAGGLHLALETLLNLDDHPVVVGSGQRRCNLTNFQASVAFPALNASCYAAKSPPESLIFFTLRYVCVAYDGLDFYISLFMCFNQPGPYFSSYHNKVVFKEKHLKKNPTSKRRLFDVKKLLCFTFTSSAILRSITRTTTRLAVSHSNNARPTATHITTTSFSTTREIRSSPVRCYSPLSYVYYSHCCFLSWLTLLASETSSTAN